MSYIIMAIDECGQETRVGLDYPSPQAAGQALSMLREQYIEYRNMWVEELKDASYWMFRDDRDEFGNDLTEYGY